MAQKKITFFFLLFFLGNSLTILGAGELPLVPTITASPPDFPSYDEVARHIKRPVVVIGGRSLDFSDIHHDMAVREYQLNQKLPLQERKKKNLFYLRFTPVYEDTVGTVPHTQSIKVEYSFSEDNKMEIVFFSSAAPLSADIQAPKDAPSDFGLSPNFPFSLNPTFLLEWFPQKGEEKSVSCRAYAGSIKTLGHRLARKFAALGIPTNPRHNWYVKLELHRRMQKVQADTNNFQGLFKDVEDLHLPSVAEYVCRVNKIVKSDNELGSFCCSEQNAFNYAFKEEILRAITGVINAQCAEKGPLKALMINGHTTKHPCRMCGLTMYSEASDKAESFGQKISRLFSCCCRSPGSNSFSELSDRTESLAQKLLRFLTNKTGDCKVMTLISYRDGHLTLPAPSIFLSEHHLMPTFISSDDLTPKFALYRLSVDENTLVASPWGRRPQEAPAIADPSAPFIVDNGAGTGLAIGVSGSGTAPAPVPPAGSGAPIVDLDSNLQDAPSMGDDAEEEKEEEASIAPSPTGRGWEFIVSQPTGRMAGAGRGAGRVFRGAGAGRGAATSGGASGVAPGISAASGPKPTGGASAPTEDDAPGPGGLFGDDDDF